MLRIVLALALLAIPQQPPPPSEDQLPNGKSRQDEMIKLDHKKNLEDSAAMAKLAEEVNEEFEKDGRFVMPLKTLKKLDEIERLAKAVRGRLKKY